MPKITNTKKQRALQMLNRLRHGPSTLYMKGNEECLEAYNLWFKSWIDSELIELCPNLKGVEPLQK